MSETFQYIDKNFTYAHDRNQILETYQSTIDKDRNSLHFVCWSGGADSTCLLYELLDAYGSSNVVAISMKYPWLLTDKWESEKMHREAIKAKLKLLGPKFTGFKHTEFIIEEDRVTGSLLQAVHERGGSPQLVGWMLNAVNYAENDSYVYTGAIRDDDISIINNGEGYCMMFEGAAKVVNKRITLREPYMRLPKTTILEKLFKYNLYDVVWFCELPRDINRVCHKCNPCILHKNSLQLLATNQCLHPVDEITQVKAKEALDKLNEDQQELDKYDEPKSDNTSCINLVDNGSDDKGDPVTSDQKAD